MCAQLALTSTGRPACPSLPAPMAECGTASTPNACAPRTPSGTARPASPAATDKFTREHSDASAPTAPFSMEVNAHKSLSCSVNQFSTHSGTEISALVSQGTPCKAWPAFAAASKLRDTATSAIRSLTQSGSTEFVNAHKAIIKIWDNACQLNQTLIHQLLLPAMSAPTSTISKNDVLPAPMAVSLAPPATPAPSADLNTTSIPAEAAALKSAETARGSLWPAMTATTSTATAAPRIAGFSLVSTAWEARPILGTFVLLSCLLPWSSRSQGKPTSSIRSF